MHNRIIEDRGISDDLANPIALYVSLSGIRRCKKSSLLDLFHQYLLEQDVPASHIIHMNLESLCYRDLTDYLSFYDYISKGEYAVAGDPGTGTSNSTLRFVGSESSLYAVQWARGGKSIMNQYVTGTTIKELREKNKITQMQLAEKIGVSDETISKWETGVSHS